MNAFRALHVKGDPFVMPNPWDAGSARMLAGLGFRALASTSAGAAFTRGKIDGALSIDEMLAASREVQDATDLPVNADLENGGGDAPEDAALAIRRAADQGLAGASIEDLGEDGRIYSFDHALARIEAAIRACAGTELLLTARTEIMLQADKDFEEVLRRIRAFAKAGADVVYAPGLTSSDQIRTVVDAAGDTPVNVLVGNNTLGLTRTELGALGAARISVGAALSRVAYGAMIDTARRMLEPGEFAYPERGPKAPSLETLLK